MESEFPGNSKNTPRPKAPIEGVSGEEKKVPKVTTGQVVRRKKSFFKRFSERLTGGENAASVFDYVMFDILVPAAKDIFLDATYAGLERKFYGEVRSTGRRGYSRGLGGRTDYNRISSGSVLRNDPRDHVRDVPRRSRGSHDVGEILLSSRVEAAAVLDQLFELLSRYHIVTVADLYSTLGEPSTFQDNKFGWDDLRGSDVERVRDGYVLILPRPIPID